MGHQDFCRLFLIFYGKIKEDTMHLISAEDTVRIFWPITKQKGAIMKKETDRIALLLKIGILGALVILAGDLLMGWGVRDERAVGMEGQLSQYLTVSQGRMFWASVCGFSGVPIAVIGHYGIYKLLKPFSRKYARMYALGILGFLAFGGAGVHVSSVEAAFFYQHMTAADPAAAVDATVKFALYFLLPLYGILITGWAVMVYAHMRAVLTGLSPFPRWGWIFSMPIGTLLFSLTGLWGNHPAVNALMVGAFSLGNVYTLCGHLWMLGRTENQKYAFHLKKL